MKKIVISLVGALLMLLGVGYFWFKDKNVSEVSNTSLTVPSEGANQSGAYNSAATSNNYGATANSRRSTRTS